MQKPSKQFRLCAEVRALAERKGEVRITSDIFPYKLDDDTVTSNDFHKSLESLGDVDEITVRINSPGGSLREAVAIRTELMEHKAKKTVEIMGLCASAATIIACIPGATVRMAQGAEYMIHRCLYGAYGHADDVLAAYQSMMVSDGNMAEIYAERTGKSKEECLDLMIKETWMNARDAKAQGFVDEVEAPDAEDMDLVACTVDADTMALMRECYANAPEYAILESHSKPGEGEKVSYGSSAVAADSPSENILHGGIEMDQLKNATAEQLQQENPALLDSIAKQAVAAERRRIQEIDALTPNGEKYAEMARQAKDAGTSAADFLRQVIAAQKKTGEEYLTARAQETANTAKIGGGDTKDSDGGAEAKEDKWARDVAELAKGMNAETREMM